MVVNPMMISDADIARSRVDPRFKQVLLARVLEQLLGTLYRLQHSPSLVDHANAADLREGALIAIKLADLIRAIDEKLSVPPVRH